MAVIAPLAIAIALIRVVVANTVLQLDTAQTSTTMPLPHNLLAFSIEADRWPDWAGNVSNKNQFTFNLLQNLKTKTGVAPRIRVGGDTQDRVIFNANLTTEPGFSAIFPAIPVPLTTTTQIFPEANFVSAGPDYYLCAGNLPAGTAFTWGVNFGVENISEIIVQVQEVEKAFADPFLQNVELFDIEMGNEADLWAGNKRPSNWNVTQYAAQQVQYFDAINAALGNNGRKYRTADFAVTWSASQLFSTNLTETDMAPFINAISEHHYQGGGILSPESAWPVVASNLISKNNIRANLSRYEASVAVGVANNITFVLGETNTFSGHGQEGVSNSAAAALWMVDYTLQAASKGIGGVYFHQGIGYNYSAFEPLDKIGSNVFTSNASAKHHILPFYYGYLAVADAIGNAPADTFITEITTNNTDLAGYEIWENEKLVRVMLINETPWTELSTGTRPEMNISFPGLVNSNTTYKRLSFPSLSALNGLTWGGQSWDTPDGLASGNPIFTKLASDGLLVMEASSAVLLYLS